MKFLLKATFLFLIRNWKSSEIQLMSFVLFISIIFITSVTFLQQALQAGLEDKTGALLGSDRAISSPVPLDNAMVRKAQTLNLKTTLTINFLTMLVHDKELTLGEVRAVEKGYPLRGNLRIAANISSPDFSTSAIPAVGTVWIQAPLFSRLNIKIGDTVGIGSAFFKVEQVLTEEPDRTIEGMHFEPIVLMNAEDVALTEIVQPGSRVNHTLQLMGAPEKLSEFETWVKPILTPSQKWIDVRHGRPIINQVVERINHYLGLVFFINIALAGIAIMMVAKQFTRKQFDTVAILRCFGASNEWILYQYLGGLLLLGIGLGIGGIGIGYWLSIFFKKLFFKELLTNIPATGLTYLFPILSGVLTVLVLILGFALPPLLAVRKITPLRIIRKDLPPPTLNHYGSIVLSFVAIIGLMVLQTREMISLFSLIFFSLGMILILFGMIYILLHAIANIGHFFKITLQFNIRNIRYRARENALQVLAFALVFGFIGTLYLLRNDLIRTWQEEVPPLAPNHFVINIPPKAFGSFHAFLQNQGVANVTLYPMVLGRLMAVNEEPVEMGSELISNKRVFNRLLNLTWSEHLPRDNEIMTGAWFKNNDKGQLMVSVEEGFAKRLKIKLGDMIKLQISEKTLSLKVTSIRTVKWNSFQPNFFIIFPPGVIDKLSFTYMTSFYLPANEGILLRKLVEKFPMVNIIDTELMLTQLRKYINLMSLAVEYLWSLTFMISLVLLFATIMATLDERKKSALLFRILGVGNRQLFWIIVSEFLLLGFLAGMVGIMGANAILYWFSEKLFNLPYRVDFMALIGIPLFGMVLVSFAGWLGTRKIFTTAPIKLLSEVS